MATILINTSKFRLVEFAGGTAYRLIHKRRNREIVVIGDQAVEFRIERDSLDLAGPPRLTADEAMAVLWCTFDYLALPSDNGIE